jgi:phosphonate metabolism protein PhnN/1,5-bisphosphokinase (PRPP-forming)
VDETEFAARLARGEFALHWQAHGLHYGVPSVELAPLAQGRDVMVNGSRAALAEAQAAFPALTVLHITAPLDVLADRLAARGRETRADIAARLARAAQSLPEGLPVLEVLNDATPEAGITRLLQALRG